MSSKKIAAGNNSSTNSDGREITGTDFDSLDKRGIDINVLNETLNVINDPANQRLLITYLGKMLIELEKLNTYMQIITDEELL